MTRKETVLSGNLKQVECPRAVIPANAEWHLLQLGSSIIGPCEAAVIQASRALSAYVPTKIIPRPAGGLVHEAGPARARAALLANTLSAGAVAVLASSYGLNGMSLGDPMISDILPFLPANMEGTIIGAMAHGHVLSILAARYPSLRVLIGPPIVETIGASNDPLVIEAAVRAVINLWKYGPKDCVLMAGETTLPARLVNPGAALEEPKTYAIHPKTLRPGCGTGPVIAGNLAALGMVAGSPEWPDASGAVLFWESSELRRMALDRALKRLVLVRAFEGINAMIVAVPISEILSPIDTPLSAIIEDILEGTSYPVVIDAFVSLGPHALTLMVGGLVSVDAKTDSVRLTWN
jgi:LD-carboxypeptidase C-terminal domain